MERMLMEYLVNSLWQAPVLAAGAWLVLRAGRPGPRVQHGVWVAALVLMVAMPLLSLRGMDADASVVAPVVAPVVVLPEVESVAMQDVVPVVAQASDLPRVAEVPASRLRMREVRLSAGTTHRVVELYLAVMGFAMMRLLWGWMVARRMVGEAVVAELSDAESALLGVCCERLGVRRPEVLVSARTSSPLVVGVVRPVLLLPERFAEDVERDGQELEAVWWHELAHVRRRDYLANLLCRIWALPVAYHPATYAVERRVRQTREILCDGVAAAEMQSRVGYARCLVGLAKRMQHGCAAPGQLQGTGMFGNGVLEERVMELIGTKLVESVRMRALRAASGVAMLVVVMGAAAMFHVTPTMAQEASAGAGATSSEAVAPAVGAVATPMQTAAPGEAAAPAQTAAPVNPVASGPSAVDPARIQRKMDAAKAKIDEVESALDRANKQMTEAQREAITAALQANEAAIERQTELMNSPEFKKQMEKMNSPEFQEQMEKLNGALIKKEMEANRPELKKQMEDARRQLEDATNAWNDMSEKTRDSALRERLLANADHAASDEWVLLKMGKPAGSGPEQVSPETMAGSLIFKADPVYPAIAKAAHVSGPVVLDAVISKTGTIKALSIVSGPQMLQLSAINAVEQWKYKPYLVNGSPVEVKTSVTVNFALAAARSPVGPVRLSQSEIMQNIVSKADPVYPADVKTGRVRGTVLLDVVISKTGTVEALGMVSGPELLQLSAIDAVKQWKFKPYLMHGLPTEVETTITVNFAPEIRLSLLPGAAPGATPSFQPFLYVPKTTR